MQVRTEIINGKRRICITKSASGEDKAREAVLKVMGNDEYEYKEEVKHE
ncbi:hypothetical protein CLTEP_02660 [Clostridium tepidiprofundi DSM 19306]|uniref:Uncharacterized protein n=1 Tax=Clostridium tepidiprofundi DSM 19306 TaxID=1121338 RepID=A0A151B7T7_9CLOT|nr:hypothetical protein [Clostridium tepidiprofundi]KYH35873.1 hypothetical protein CLTEP_02660 [Clostridium tepidiprofundi DSM 19306]